MAYTPINWQNGDTITAEKMNKMDNGWSVDSTQLFSETATTSAGQFGNQAILSYSETNFPDVLTVTFENIEYRCEQQDDGGGTTYYGAPNPADWSTYPFILIGVEGGWILITENAGTYTISASVDTINVSSNFAKAVSNATGLSPMLCVDGVTTYGEMLDAFGNNRMMYFVHANAFWFVTEVWSNEVVFTPTNPNFDASFTNDVFTITD